MLTSTEPSIANVHFPANAPRYAAPADSFLSLNQAAQAAGCHPSTIRNAIKAGRLAASTIGSAYIIERADLERFVSARKV